MSIILKIAGISLCFKFEKLPNKLYSKLKDRYSGFFSSKKLNAINIFVKFENFKKRYPSKPRIKLEKNSLLITREDFCFEMKYPVANLKIAPSIYSFDSFLRTMLSFLLPEEGGVLLHSSSLFYKGKAYIFVGKSGSGKTTIAELSKKNAFIMSDELTPIFVNGYAYSSPFWGNMKGKGENKKARIGKILIIKKANFNKIDYVEFDEFISYFLPCVMNFSSSLENIRKIMDITISLYKNFKVEKLFFSKEDNSFLKVI